MAAGRGPTWATRSRARGEGQRARQIIAQLSDQPPGGYIPAFQIARVYTGLDEPEEAFRWLETAYEERAGWMVMLAVTPELDTLRADPRFADLERRVGLRP